MDATIVVALAAAGGVVLGSLITVFGNWLNNRHQADLQKALWEQEDRRADRAADAQRRASAIEAAAKERERLEAIYSDCVRGLSALSAFDEHRDKGGLTQADVDRASRDFKEVQRDLSLLVINHYDPGSEAFIRFYSTYKENFADVHSDLFWADKLRSDVIEFARDDPRLRRPE